MPKKNDDETPERPKDLETTVSKKSDPNHDRSDNSTNGGFSHDDMPSEKDKRRKRD